MSIEELKAISESFVRKCTTSIISPEEYATYFTKLMTIGYSIEKKLVKLSKEYDKQVSDEDVTTITMLNHWFTTLYDFFMYCGHKFPEPFIPEAHVLDNLIIHLQTWTLTQIKFIVEDARGARRDEPIFLYITKAGTSVYDIIKDLKRVNNFIKSITGLGCVSLEEIEKNPEKLSFSDLYEMLASCIRRILDTFALVSNPDMTKVDDKIYVYNPDIWIFRLCKTFINFAKKLLDKDIVKRIDYTYTVCLIYKDRALIKIKYIYVYISKIADEYFIIITPISKDVLKTILNVADRANINVHGYGDDYIILSGKKPEDVLKASVFVLPFLLSINERLQEVEKEIYTSWLNLFKISEIREIERKYTHPYEREAELILKAIAKLSLSTF
jgi:hypothetical protein